MMAIHTSVAYASSSAEVFRPLYARTGNEICLYCIVMLVRIEMGVTLEPMVVVKRNGLELRVAFFNTE